MSVLHPVKSAYLCLKGSIVQMLLCQKCMQNHTLSTTTVRGPPPPLKQKGEKGSVISVMQCVDNSLKHDNI